MTTGAAEQVPVVEHALQEDPPKLPVGRALALILLVGGAMAMGETDRLVTGALTATGESRSVADVIGMAALGGRNAWSDWMGLPDGVRDAVAIWIFFHALFDIALYLGYFLFLRSFIPPNTQARRILKWLLRFEVIETVLLWAGSAQLFACDRDCAVPGLFTGSVAFLATAKWVTVGLLVLAVLVDDKLRTDVGRDIVRLVRALFAQRLSVVVVAVFGVLSVVPLPHIWDQLPDVQRSWTDQRGDDGLHPWLAALATALLAAYLFVVGRLVSERVWTTRVGSLPGKKPQVPQGSPPWLWFVVPPLLVVGAGGVLEALRPANLVDWQKLLGFAVLFPLLIVVMSGLVRIYYRVHRVLRTQEARIHASREPLKWWERLLRWSLGWGRWKRWLKSDRSLWQQEPEPADPENEEHARWVWSTGDLLAVLVIVVGGLGLVRSLLAPVLLWRLNGIGDPWPLRLEVLLVGVAVAGGAVPLAAVLLGRLDRTQPPPGTGKVPISALLRPHDNRRPGGPFRSVLAVVLWVAAIVLLVVLMMRPLQFGRTLGVVATTLLALGTWILVLGLLIVHHQHLRPLPIFSALHIRTTPILTLLIVVPLLASQGGGDPDLHALQPPPGAPAPVPTRANLAAAFGDWVERSGACDREVTTRDGKRTVRPMVLVAASGGGIRAAVWTAAVMQQLRDERVNGKCAAQSVFLSSGVSGGSVGLALSRGTDPKGDAERLAEPDALAAGVAGTLVGDLIAGSTGLRIPSLVEDEHGKEPGGRERWAWRDRAGLMEAAWESKAGTLTTRYGELPGTPAGVLVLNSTEAVGGCRILVSQVQLPAGPRAAADGRSRGPAGCQGQTGQASASLDLQDIYGQCTPDMSWATASMLSARFPTITPSGRVPPVTRVLPPETGSGSQPRSVTCSGAALQLIDGGYAEGSGVGTLADVAPALVSVIRDHNAGAAGPLVVPVVLYLEDETRHDIVRQPGNLSAELFVPLAGRKAKGVQTSTGTWLQRAATGIADPCPAGELRERCLDAVAAINGNLSGGVVVAGPLTQPSVEAPLGWTLSEDSLAGLERAATGQATACPTPKPGSYRCLKDLLGVLEPTAR
jgi:hypothetical protein